MQIPLHFLWRSSIVPGFFKPSESLLDEFKVSEESGFSKFGNKPEVGGGGEGGGGTEAANTFPILIDFMRKNFNNFCFPSVQMTQYLTVSPLWILTQRRIYLLYIQKSLMKNLLIR